MKIDRGATSDEIRCAFRKLSIEYHPDKTPGNVDRATLLFQQMLEAYECLIDEGKRRLNDAQLEVENRRGWWGWYQKER